MSTKPDTQQTDINGYPVCVGDLIKIYHFTDRRKRRHYMYKLVVLVDGHLYAMHASEIARRWKGAHKCHMSCIDKFEIIQGFGPRLGADFRDRVKMHYINHLENYRKEKEICTT